MKYSTVGTIKVLKLSGHTFTLESISNYRFETKEGDENSWKIVFKEESGGGSSAPNSLMLKPKDTIFPFDPCLDSAMVALKQAKSKIKVVVEEQCLTQVGKEPSGDDVGERDNSDVTAGSANTVVPVKTVLPVEIEVL